MIEEVLTNVISVLLTIFSVGAVAAIFALLLYLLIRGRLTEVNTITVTDGNNRTLAGIPFYVKRGRLTHETTYLERLGTYTLTAKKVTLDAQDEPTESRIEFVGVKTVSQSSEVLGKLAEIRMELAVAQDEPNPNRQQTLWESIKKKFDEMPPYGGQMPTHELPREGNVIKESSFVDYENTFYLNKLQPLSGSSDLDITLADDGTLTKVTAKTQDNTFEKLLGLLPTDSFLSQPEAEAAEEEAVQKARVLLAKPKTIYEFSLAEKQQYVRHVLFMDFPFSYTERGFKAPIPQNNKNCWYRREIVADLSQKEEEPAGTQGGEDEKSDEE